MAIQLYIDDHDYTFPGPNFIKQQSGYDSTTPFYLGYYLWRYLGLRDPSVPRTAGGPDKTRENKILTCPAMMARPPRIAGQTPGDRTNFRLNNRWVNPTVPSAPFGYPIGANPPAPPNDPGKESALHTITNRGEFYALRDVDQEIDGSTTPPAWKGEIPAKPAHGRTRNWMFFDWHVESTTRTNYR